MMAMECSKYLFRGQTNARVDFYSIFCIKQSVKPRCKNGRFVPCVVEARFFGCLNLMQLIYLPF